MNVFQDVWELLTRKRQLKKLLKKIDELILEFDVELNRLFWQTDNEAKDYVYNSKDCLDVLCMVSRLSVYYDNSERKQKVQWFINNRMRIVRSWQIARERFRCFRIEKKNEHLVLTLNGYSWGEEWENRWDRVDGLVYRLKSNLEKLESLKEIMEKNSPKNKTETLNTRGRFS